VREAGLIAEHIALLVRDQPFQVEEKDENGENVRKPLSWKHFAMLFRAMSDVPIYEWALRRWDVPFYVVAGRGFYARQEVRDLLNFLKAVENRRDEVALVGVLRSPFFGVSDRAIYWLCQGRSVSANMAVLAGRLRREKGLGPLAEIEDLELRKLRRADDAICHFRRIKDRLRLGALMEAIVAETGFSSALLAGPGGDQKVSNLRKVAELARSLEHSAALSVDDFIRIVEDLVVREDREGEAPTREEESDVVKLLTVHKAKGLEWPVVIVPDCSRRPRLRSNEAFLASTEMGTVLKGEDASGASGWPAVGRLLAAEEEKKELAEHRRLFYVAATRARDHLVLSGSLRSDSTKAQNTWLSWLMEALNLDRGLAGGPTKEQEARGCTVRVRSFDPLGEDAATSERVATGGGGAVPPRPIPSLDAIRARIRVFRPDTSRRRRFTVTELEEYDACPHKFYLKRVRDLAEYHWTVPGALRLGLPESGSAQRREHASQEGALGGMELDLSPAERGTIAHRAVQRLLTIRNLPLEVLVKDCLREARIALPTHSRAFEDTCGILRRSQGTELWQRLAAAQRLEVEAPFSFRVATGLAPQTAGVAVEGALDVVASEETGQSLLADFKTGSARPDAYSFQIGLYCLALEATRGQAPGTAALYYLDRGATELLNVADLLAESKQQLVQAVRGILQSEFDRKAQVGCSGCGLFWACDQRIEAQNRRPDPANTRTG
jgi:ATP-dependent helicase/nuclease subunit A